MELYIQYDERCTHSEREPVEYGSWREEYDFRVTGVSLTSRERWGEEKFEIGCDVKAGDPVFVLYMTYSTGDSFGRAEGRGEVLWAFKDAKTATEAMKRWKEENDKRDPEFSVKFEDDVGRVIQLSNPAAGYFENMGYLELVTFLVNP